MAYWTEEGDALVERSRNARRVSEGRYRPGALSGAVRSRARTLIATTGCATRSTLPARLGLALKGPMSGAGA